MGRRRRKITHRRQSRTIPTIFNCPKCGRSAVRVELDYKVGEALVHCGNCECQATIPISPITEPVDVYGDWVDLISKEKRGV
jgi:transcription elongation factor Elf1